MATSQTRTLAVHSTLKGADSKLSFETSKVTKRLRTGLEKKLGKKNFSLEWQDDSQESEVRIRFLRIDEGSQLKRWLFPLFGPAVVEIEGEIKAPGKKAKPFHFERKAFFALFGGSAQHMVGVCIDRLASDLSKEIKNKVK